MVLDFPVYRCCAHPSQSSPDPVTPGAARPCMEVLWPGMRSAVSLG